MKRTRRDFIKTNAAAAVAAAAGVAIPGVVSGAAKPAVQEGVRWDKAPCRFCGTGCSVLVGVKDGRIVASRGDPDAPVNRGLNCIKGYFVSKIMYGQDRLTQPLLRKKNGKYDKEGEFEAVSWDEAFGIMAEKWKAAIKRDMETNKGKPPEEMISSVGMFGSGQWTIYEGYAASKLYKAGFRSNNIDPNARHCMATAVVSFMRGFGADEPMGCYDDIEHADAFVLWGSNMADAMSVPSASAILMTETPPELLRYVIDKEEIPRNFENQPPLIPHTSETKTIDLRENKCLHCHMKQPGEKAAKSKEMSKSHFVDRNGKKLDRPASNRYFCTQCHVPQVNAKPLVESNFKSLAAK